MDRFIAPVPGGDTPLRRYLKSSMDRFIGLVFSLVPSFALVI